MSELLIFVKIFQVLTLLILMFLTAVNVQNGRAGMAAFTGFVCGASTFSLLAGIVLAAQDG